MTPYIERARQALLIYRKGWLPPVMWRAWPSLAASSAANFTEDGYEQRRFKVEVSRHANGVWPNVFRDNWCGEYAAKEVR